jgi:four helix bundle protein
MEWDDEMDPSAALRAGSLRVKVSRFEELIAWQKAKVLCVNVYKAFDQSKDFGFKDQIQRASVSVMNNIAEGFERRVNKEFVYFLYLAKGSCGEVRSMLILAKELNKISADDAKIIVIPSVRNFKDNFRAD